jgi:hypothetical protein
MDNKIVLELIKKDLFELQMMVDMLHKAEKVEQMVVELTIRKTESMLAELKMLNTLEPVAASIPVAPIPEIQDRLEINEIQPKEIQPIVEELIELELVAEEPIVAAEESVAQIEEPQVIATSMKTEILEVPEVAKVPVQPEVAIQPEKPVVEKPIETEVAIQPEKPVVEKPVQPEVIAEVVPEPVAEVLPEPEPKITVVETPKQTEVHAESQQKHPSGNAKTTSEKKVLGEQFSKEPSLNERLASAAAQELNVKPQPISNMKTAIGLNDKFLFTRILFNNDSALFNEALDRIEQAANLREAVDYLNARFEWEKNDTSLKFIDLLKRRFQN